MRQNTLSGWAGSALILVLTCLALRLAAPGPAEAAPSQQATATASPSPTGSPPPTDTPPPTSTTAPAGTPTNTTIPTNTSIPTATGTATTSPTRTPSATPTITRTPTPTSTPTVTPSPTITPVPWGRTVSLGTNESVRGIACPDPANCYAIAGGSIFFTGDAGQSWGTSFAGAPRLLGISCPITSTCYAVGIQGTILATTSGGARWDYQSITTTETLVDVSCSAVDACVVVGNLAAADSLYITTTQPVWTRSARNPDAAPVVAVQCVSQVICYAAGADSTGTQARVLRSMDGGATWTPGEIVGTSPPLLDLSCRAADTCLAVGNLGAVRVTSDGAKWTLRSAPGPVQLQGVACPTPDTCFAVGEGGKVFGTTSRGLDWTFLASGTGNLLWDIACPDADNCYAGGDQGVIVTNNVQSVATSTPTPLVSPSPTRTPTLTATPTLTPTLTPTVTPTPTITPTPTVTSTPTETPVLVPRAYLPLIVRSRVAGW